MILSPRPYSAGYLRSRKKSEAATFLGLRDFSIRSASFICGPWRVGLFLATCINKHAMLLIKLFRCYSSLTYANFLTANRSKLCAFAVHTSTTYRLVVNNCKMRAWILTLKWWSHYQVLCSEFFAYHNSSSGLRHRGFSCSIFFGAAAEFESIQNVAWDLLPRQTKERALKCRKMMCCWHVANQFEADYTWKMCSLTILYDVGNLTADCYLTKICNVISRWFMSTFP